jgi:hypothetical protein
MIDDNEEANNEHTFSIDVSNINEQQKYADELKEMVKYSQLSLSETRLEVCATCENFIMKFCTVCSCFMPIKTLFNSSECPKGKW